MTDFTRARRRLAAALLCVFLFAPVSHAADTGTAPRIRFRARLITGSSTHLAVEVAVDGAGDASRAAKLVTVEGVHEWWDLERGFAEVARREPECEAVFALAHGLLVASHADSSTLYGIDLSSRLGSASRIASPPVTGSAPRSTMQIVLEEGPSGVPARAAARPLVIVAIVRTPDSSIATRVASSAASLDPRDSYDTEASSSAPFSSSSSPWSTTSSGARSPFDIVHLDGSLEELLPLAPSSASSDSSAASSEFATSRSAAAPPDMSSRSAASTSSVPQSSVSSARSSAFSSRISSSARASSANVSSSSASSIEIAVSSTSSEDTEDENPCTQSIEHLVEYEYGPTRISTRLLDNGGLLQVSTACPLDDAPVTSVVPQENVWRRYGMIDVVSASAECPPCDGRVKALLERYFFDGDPGAKAEFCGLPADSLANCLIYRFDMLGGNDTATGGADDSGRAPSPSPFLAAPPPKAPTTIPITGPPVVDLTFEPRPIMDMGMLYLAKKKEPAKVATPKPLTADQIKKINPKWPARHVVVHAASRQSQLSWFRRADTLVIEDLLGLKRKSWRKITYDIGKDVMGMNIDPAKVLADLDVPGNKWVDVSDAEKRKNSGSLPYVIYAVDKLKRVIPETKRQPFYYVNFVSFYSAGFYHSLAKNAGVAAAFDKLAGGWADFLVRVAKDIPVNQNPVKSISAPAHELTKADAASMKYGLIVRGYEDNPHVKFIFDNNTALTRHSLKTLLKVPEDNIREIAPRTADDVETALKELGAKADAAKKAEPTRKIFLFIYLNGHGDTIGGDTGLETWDQASAEVTEGGLQHTLTLEKAKLEESRFKKYVIKYLTGETGEGSVDQVFIEYQSCHSGAATGF